MFFPILFLFLGLVVPRSVLAQGEATGMMNSEVVKVVVDEVRDEKIEDYDVAQKSLNQELRVIVLDGDRAGDVLVVPVSKLLVRGEKPYKEGDRLLVNVADDFVGGEIYYVVDYVRTNSLWWLLVVFVVLVVVVAGWKGMMSMLGLASSFVIIFGVILPGIQAGFDPILVTITASLLIMIITFYLSHGFSEKTNWAVIGTFVSLVVTGVLAKIFTEAARLNGFAAEEVMFLQVIKGGTLNVRGLLLSGIIIGTLGILDDITISQASVVAELKSLNKKILPRELFLRAMNVGQDHIASLVNTLILVYTGGALPLLLLFTLDTSRGFETVINYEIVAEEIVRTLVGSIGLVLAVPITTFLAAFFGFKSLKGKVTHAHKH